MNRKGYSQVVFYIALKYIRFIYHISLIRLTQIVSEMQRLGTFLTRPVPDPNQARPVNLHESSEGCS